MNETPLPPITVIVPTHNRPELMARAVLSIVEQTYDGPIEVLVVFDACEPVLPEVPARPNRWVKALVNERAPGPAGGRNSGVLAASHELIAFLDDDDVWAATKIADQVAVVQQHPDTVLFGTAMQVDDGSRLHDRLVPFDRVTHDILLHNRIAALHTSSLLIRSEAMRGPVGLFDESLPRGYCEDYDLLLRAATIAPIVVVNRPLVVVRWQGDSHFLGAWATYAEALKCLLAKHPGFETSRRAVGRIESQIAFALAASGDRRQGAGWAWRSLRHDPRQPKAWLALAVALRVISAARVTRIARRFGRSI